MSRRKITEYSDDIDGSPLAQDDVHIVRFSIDGKNREIDLSLENAIAFRAALQPYVDASRPDSGSRRRTPAPPTSQAAESRRTNRKIREFADQRGIPVSRRGQIAKDVRERYFLEMAD